MSWPIVLEAVPFCFVCYTISHIYFLDDEHMSYVKLIKSILGCMSTWVVYDYIKWMHLVVIEHLKM